ncbi:MAG: hypothetical protein NTX66_02390 [Candidatus Falkowbacteria bacterium]|nr:hypothetical protein [Candidatus Falkowbacteria bacterium]
MYKKSGKFFLIALVFSLITPLAVKAADNYSPQNIYIPKEETRAGNVYLVGQNIVVDGNVNGDLITISQSLTVNGEVGGDIIALAQTININGGVAGNIRLAGNDINLNGPVQKNINLLAAKINFSERATANEDLLLAGTTADINGSILGNLYGFANIFNISGKVGKNVNLKTPNNSQPSAINISSEAIINGDFNYTSRTTANIINKAAITGKITQIQPELKQTSEIMAWLWRRLYSLFAALIIGLVLVSLFKKKIVGLDKDLEDKVKKIIWPGLIALIIAPIVVIILAITFIGLPLALILLALWLIAMYLAKILVAITFGLWLSGKLLAKQKNNLILVMIIGVVATWILFSLPYLGWLISLLATIGGLGLIYLLKKENY